MPKEITNVEALFFHPDISQGILDEQESFHAVKVLRLKPGERISVTDGMGTFARAVITEIQNKILYFDILEKQTKDQRTAKIHIALAPTKNIDRVEWFVEKSTELGIEEISFVLCERSERKVIHLERLEKLAISALKQSLAIVKPVLRPLISFSDFVRQTDSHQKFIAHLEEGSQSLFASVQPKNASTVLIGPEGDFSAKELLLAKNANYSSVTLGSSRLRTETAALIACHTINLRNEIKN